MKFNPLNNNLYTHQGALIKKLHCPRHTQWDDMDQSSEFRVRNCAGCQRAVYDTAFFSDPELLQIVENNPDSCLKVDLNQNNLIVSYEEC
jgi:hypothetical protein